MARRIQNIVVSVHQRLLNKARKSSRPFNELLLHFAIERFIYRLSKSPHADNFILKGALMLLTWNAAQSRATVFSPSFAKDPDKSVQWQGFIRKAKLSGAPEALEDVVEAIKTLIQPILVSRVQERPFNRTWVAPGPSR